MPMRQVAALLPLLIASVAAAQQPRQRTYANPIDIDYRYNWEQARQGISYRSGADPVIVRHGGEYFLFVTVSGGYWHSRDLLRWRFVTPTRWPFEDVVAPAAISFGDTLLLMASATSPRPILFATQPASGRLEFYNRMLPQLPSAVQQNTERPNALVHRDSVQPSPWDPALFRDDDGRWYLYWGSSNVYPLWGIELDPARRLDYMPQRPDSLLSLHPDRHGWERFGQDHRDSIRPFVEGAWMTKHRGRYYLQYGAPGTEFNVYATGVYVGDRPLGPFTYAPYNPVGYKPGGFVHGAGHGNTFQDVHGNWWNTGTPWVGFNWNFERRIALFPAGFDADGQMYVSTRFGDFPHYMPTGRWQSSDSLFTGWMLLSYRRAITASSARDSFPASHAADENPRTLWVARTNRAGEWLATDLGAAYDVKAIQVNFGDYQSGRFATDSTVYTRFTLQTSMDGRSWTTVARVGEGERRDRVAAYVELPAPVRARHVRFLHGYVGAAHLAVSDLRVFGNGRGASPRTPTGVSARRDADQRNAHVTWDRVPNAVGYNVRWGIAPTKLHLTYQRLADQGTSLELRALTVGQRYWVAIESFDENGVSMRSEAVEMR